VPSPDIPKLPRRATQFISTRTAASVLSLLYSLAYTAYLGPERRSVLTFVLTTSMVLTVVFTSGLSLYTRSRPRTEIDSSFVWSYLFLSIGLALLVAIFSTGILVIYANDRFSLPIVLVFLCFLYSFLSTLTLSLIDCLIALGMLKFSMIFDFLLVLVQIQIGALFVVLNQTSEIVAIIVSFLASYLIISFSILTLLAFLFPYNNIKFMAEVNTLITKSRHLYVVGVSSGIVDRIDKLIIGLILPLDVLGKYALTSGVLTFSRFLPEAIAKSMFFEGEQAKAKISKTNMHPRKMAVLFGSLILSIFAAEVIVFLFGEEWNLPFTFTLVFSFQELVRAYYQMSISKLLLNKRADIVAKSAQSLLILSLTFIPLLTYLLGIYGPPVALILVYLIMHGYINSLHS
jgi:O-antigen/teichoic acid export membrane protein